MKPRRIFLFLLNSIIFLSGVMAGAIVQKTFGVGNALRAIGIPYPTAAPPRYSASLASVEIPQDDRGQMSLFILAGQSNMVGLAPVLDDEKTDRRIYVFSNDYSWRIASEPIDSAYNQVDKVSEDLTAGFGPSLAFAFASLDRHPKSVIGLIPCAKSASTITQWQRNLSDQSLYGSCLKRARAASSMGQISGVLFFQGETDALDPYLFPQYEPNSSGWSFLFSSFVTDFRRDLPDPALPIVFAQLGPNPASEEFPNWNLVKTQQISIQLPRTTMIITDDLPLLDGLHFTRESYQQIGERFANAYWDLVRLRNSSEQP